MKPRVSIIVPVLNEGQLLLPLLQMLQIARQQGHQLILSDGGSQDGSLEAARALVDHLIQGSAGRAAQMNRAAKLAEGDYLWFLHVDTRFAGSPIAWLEQIVERQPGWGFCQVRLDADAHLLRMIAWFMNQRSSLTSIATGDQGLFIRRELFQSLDGFAEIPLMEDIEISKRLKRHSLPRVIRRPLITSARRWQRHGVLATIGLMWSLRLRYFLGATPERLAERYRACNSPTPES